MEAEIKADIDRMIAAGFQDRDYATLSAAINLKIKLLELQLSYSPLPINVSNKN